MLVHKTKHSFSNKVLYDSNWIPMGIIILFLIYIVLFIVLYLDSKLYANGWLLIFYILSCLSLSIQYVHNLKRKAKDTFRWKKIKAKILNKNIFVHYSVLRPYLYPYQLRITYEYTVKGITIKSDQFALGQFGDRHCNYFFEKIEDVKKLESELIENETLNIYINPKNIYESVVKQGYDPYREPSYLTVLFSFLLAFIIAYIYIFV